MLVIICQTTAWCHNPEDHYINLHSCKNSKTYNCNVLILSIMNSMENLHIFYTHYRETCIVTYWKSVIIFCLVESMGYISIEPLINIVIFNSFNPSPLLVGWLLGNTSCWWFFHVPCDPHWDRFTTVPVNCLIDLARAPAPTCPSPHHPFETGTYTHMATYTAHPLWHPKCWQHSPHPQSVKINCWISLHCWNICLKLNIITSCFEVKLEDEIHTRLCQQLLSL